MVTNKKKKKAPPPSSSSIIIIYNNIIIKKKDSLLFCFLLYILEAYHLYIGVACLQIEFIRTHGV